MTLGATELKLNVGNKSIEFHEDFIKQSILMDMSCFKDKKCPIWKKLETISIKKIPSLKFKVNDAHPGAIICDYFEGKVVVGIDRKGNEYSLCQFEDHYLGSASLFYHANQNDLK